MATSSSFALKARSWIDCTATDYVHKQSIGESPAASHQNVQARVARSGIEGMMRGMRRAYNLRVPSGYPKVPWFTSIGGLPAVCIAKKGRYRVQASSSNADNAQSAKGVQEWPLPTTSDLSVEQARGACQRAIADGKKRLQIDLLLPLIGATDLDDWPGGIKQQFKAAVPLVYSLLRGLVGTSSAEASKKYLLDEADAVGVWESANVALVLFPNADTVPELERLAKVEGRPLLIMNPQWQAGQVISDFGFGARRQASEDFLATFEPAYQLQQKRIQGEDVRLLRCYPGPYQVYLIDDRGKSDVVTSSEALPTYKKIDALLRSRVGSRASKSWLEKLMGETKFNLENKF